jgi:hypothetical protein
MAARSSAGFPAVLVMMASVWLIAAEARWHGGGPLGQRAAAAADTWDAQLLRWRLTRAPAGEQRWLTR